MKFQNTKVMNFQGAFRGLRNPLQSWKKSDSAFGLSAIEECDDDFDIAGKWVETIFNITEEDNYLDFSKKQAEYISWLNVNGILQYNNNNGIIEYAFLGPNDLNLAQRMISAGTSDRKFLRQIFVSVDITAPLYWFKQFDTYKIGTVANSTSTMHKLSSTPIVKECFEMDDFEDLILYNDNDYTTLNLSNDIIKHLETLRKKFIQTKDKKYWKELIRWLPDGWLQKRTITFNYENLRNIYFQRRNHKLTEWQRQFCDWIKTLPYAEELIIFDNK